MKKIIDFLIEVGKLKRMPRRGWVINRIKNPESIADHTFRAAILAWVLAKRKKGIKVERLLKIALVHDLCEVYAGDITPYDSVLPRSNKKLKELMKTWPRFSKAEKRRNNFKKKKKETIGLNKLLATLPPDLKILQNEIKSLWVDYENGLSPEGRFFKQADRLENFLQALEYWKKYKKPPQQPWWLWAREFFDDPLLLDFIEEMDGKFHKERKPRV